jgi:hypothetical protein
MPGGGARAPYGLSGLGDLIACNRSTHLRLCGDPSPCILARYSQHHGSGWPKGMQDLLVGLVALGDPTDGTDGELC